MQLDHGEAANRHRHHTAKEVVEFVRSSFRQISLGQSAGVDVNRAAQRSSRSWRTNTSLGTFRLGIELRNSAREGIRRRGRTGKILARGRPLRVTTTSPASATSSSRCESADLILRILRVFNRCSGVGETSTVYESHKPIRRKSACGADRLAIAIRAHVESIAEAQLSRAFGKADYTV
jgi:hypothetical protein